MPISSIEHSLLLSLTGLEIIPENQSGFSDISWPDIDMDTLISLSVKEGLTGLLYKNLKKFACLEYFSKNQKKKLQNIYNHIVILNIGFQNALKQILGRLKYEKIQVVLLQGISLLDRVYKDIGERPMTDIDLWVPENKFPQLTRVLIDIGYKRDQIYPGTFIKGSVIIDVHTHIFGGERIRSRQWLIRKRQENIFYNCRSVNIQGKDALCLSPEDQILYLCLHALKHNLSKLIWLADISFILKGCKTDQWRALTGRADELGLEKILIYIIYVLRHAFNQKFPAQLIEFTKDNRLNPFEKKLLMKRVNFDKIPSWGPLLLYSPAHGPVKRICFYFETLFPKKDILMQIFPHYSGNDVWYLYLLRIEQLMKMIRK